MPDIRTGAGFNSPAFPFCASCQIVGVTSDRCVFSEGLPWSDRTVDPASVSTNDSHGHEQVRGFGAPATKLRTLLIGSHASSTHEVLDPLSRNENGELVL